MLFATGQYNNDKGEQVMATIKEIPAVGTGNQVVGKVVILYGTVKAISADGTVRLLMPNSPIFANDRIVTESDGNVSIMFDGSPPTQMDLGRMSNVAIDEDVYAGVSPSVTSDAAAEFEQIEKALMAGDQPIHLEAPAAGGAASDGGGHPLFVVNVTGAEVTPTSGAETIGVTYGALAIPEGVVTTPTEAPPTPISVTIGTSPGHSSATEGNPVTFTLHQDTVNDHDTTVTVQVVGAPGDTATAGADYTPITTLDVTILAGQQDATFTVNTLTDQLQEGQVPETFTAHIVSAANQNGAVTVGTADAVGSIVDANVAPLDTTASVNESAMDTVKSGSDLAQSNDTGTNPSSPNETATGSLNLQPGWTAVASSGTTLSGTYEIHQDGTFIYTLINAPDVSGDLTTDTISYSITNGGVTQTDNTLTVNIVDDVPTITADNIAIPNIADTYEGTYNFDVGADTQAFNASIDSESLSWTNAASGYSLVYDPTNSNPSAQVYNGTFNNGADTFFTITVNSDSTYLFNLVEPKPVVESPLIDILQGVDGGSNLSEYSFGSATFSGYFDLVATGYENGNLSTLTISSTDLGVGDNVIQEHSGDVLRFELHPTQLGSENNVTVSEFTVSLADNASINDGTLVELDVHYTDSSVVNMTDAYFKANGGDLVFELDPLKTVDYLELYNYAGDSKDYSFKIDEVGLKYSTTSYPDNYNLQFSLSGADADGDSASANFTVEVNTSTATGYEIMGTSGIDSLYGTAGNDTLSGDTGADTFMASQGHDHISDYKVVDHDVVDISNLLANASRANLSVGADPVTGKAQLHIYSDAVVHTPATEVGSITFDNISSVDAPNLDTLLGSVDVKDGTHHIT
jgi:hypothetical protein